MLRRSRLVKKPGFYEKPGFFSEKPGFSSSAFSKSRASPLSTTPRFPTTDRGNGLPLSDDTVRRIALVAIVFGFLLQSGCARRVGISWPCWGVPACVEEPVSEQKIEPVIEEIAASQETASIANGTFGRLTAAECQSRAVAAAMSADLIELERSLAQALACCASRKAACAMLLTRDLLALRVAEERHAAACDALEMFYRLAEFHGRRQQLEQGIKIAQNATDRLDRLHREGLLPDVDRRLMDRQQWTLLDQQAQLVLARQQLDDQLHVLLGCAGGQVHQEYWPDIDWKLQPISIDMDSEVSNGLSNRHGLQAVRLVLNRLDTDTLPVAQGVLKSVDASTGIVTKPGPSFLRCRGFDWDELAVRNEQLMHLLATSEELAAAEIRSGLKRLEVEYTRAILADQVLASWEARRDELIKKRDITDTTWLDITKTELELLAAKSSLIERIAAVHIAEIKLRKSQGLMPIAVH
ncbi:MAG: hypothetical protein JW829_03865 [Pirellulales bacterium]|nr:hypothetical protein [Pirellulales bacterium]